MGQFLDMAGLFLVACSCSDSSAASARPPESRTPEAIEVDDFACFDHTGKFQRLSRNSDAKLVVLYVFATECPIVRQQAGELVELSAEFAPRGVRFLCLDSSPQDRRESVAQEASELGLTLPILMDETQCVAEMLGLTRTAEALVIETRSWKLLWRGPLDDRQNYVGQRDATARSWLREALEAGLARLDDRQNDVGQRDAPARSWPREALAAGLASQPAEPDVPLTKGCALTFLEPLAKHEVTYVRDVAPILVRRCVPCHREGGIGPWKMDGYEKLRGWSEMTREVVLARIMPPWHADPAHGDFLEDIGLEPAEARALVHWVELGAPRGTGEDPLAGKVEPLPEWPLGKPDLIVDIGLQEIPATGRLPNRDISVELKDHLTDRWVRALDLRPSNTEVLHHAFAFVPEQQELDTLVDQLAELPKSWQENATRWLAENPDGKELPPEYSEALLRRAFQGRSYFAKFFGASGSRVGS